MRVGSRRRLYSSSSSSSSKSLPRLCGCSFVVVDGLHKVWFSPSPSPFCPGLYVHRDDGGEEGRVTTDDEGGGRRKAAHKTTHFCRSPPFYETRTAFVHRLAAEARGEFTQYTVGITYQEEFHPLENWNKYIAGIWRFF